MRHGYKSAGGVGIDRYKYDILQVSQNSLEVEDS